MTGFYIYVHCKPDGSPFYVGKGKGARCYNMVRRSQFHKNITAKYGAQNIKVYTLQCATEAAAFQAEIELIAHLRGAGFRLANITDGGEGCAGRPMPEKTRAAISAANKGRRNSPEAIAKTAALNKGTKRSAESRKRMSLAASQRAPRAPRSEESRAKTSASLMGHGFTDEARAKMSAAQRQRTASPETRAKMSAAHLRRYAA